MSLRLLDSTNAAIVRQAVADGDNEILTLMRFDTISLSAAIELSCAQYEWVAANNSLGVAAFEKLGSHFAVLKAGWAELNRVHGDPRSGLRSNGNFSLCGVGSKQTFKERTWTDFKEHLVAQLKSSGFETTFAWALSATFTEIAENIPDHSMPADIEMAAGLIGYIVLPGEFHFAVGDVGRGVLSSLHENPRWTDLSTSRDAIEATLENGATRKREHLEGGGLKLALKSFVDRNGILRMTSGDATALASRDTAGRKSTYGFLPFTRGTRVSATCVMRGIPSEKPLPQNLI